MAQTGTHLKVRPGVAEDLAAVQEVCKDVWDGHDYLPHMWEEYCADPKILPFVAEIGNQAAGLFLLEVVEGEHDTSIWWFGVRVATPFKKRGLAGKMVEAAMEECRDRNLPVLRYATVDVNYPMHRLADRYHFRLVTKYQNHVGGVGSSIPDPGLPVRILTDSDLLPAWELLKNGTAWKHSEGCWCDGWTWKKWDLNQLQARLEKGLVAGVFHDDKLAALAVFRPDDWNGKPMTMVEWLEGSLAGQTSLICWLWQKAAEAGSPDQAVVLNLIVPDFPELHKLLSGLGLKEETHEYLRLYELPLKA